jgi:hypothetical protein
MKEPRWDKKVSWLAFNLSETRFWRWEAGIEAVPDKRCVMDCLFWVDEALDMDIGRE